MPRKGIRSIFRPSEAPSFAVSPRSRDSLSTPLNRLSGSVIEQIIGEAESMIMKWNPDTSDHARVTSLFHESKIEALQFLKCMNDLQKAMRLLVPDDSNDDRLARAQKLMQIAMKRLQKEFYQILSVNRAHLDPESVFNRSSRTSTRSSTSDFEDDHSPDDYNIVLTAGNSISEVENVPSIATSDLRSIAECMISSGYAKECVSVYKIIRKSIIDESIYKFGVEKVSSLQVKRMGWEALETRIKNWLEAVKISLRTLFTGERILCDQVFAASDSMRESCFSDTSKEGATLLFGFPELVSKSKKSSPERVFRVLDMYTSISENWAKIESIFSFESTSAVRSQALSSLIRLGESVRSMLSYFESNVQKDSSKMPVSGSGVHPLTIYAMDYLTLLGAYSNVLPDILADWPPPPKSPLPEWYFESPNSSDSSPAPAISMRFAWLILVLLCKLDEKAKHCKDVSRAYLFLANNLQHVASELRASNLQYLPGEEWITKHEAKVRQFATNYERLAWGPVIATLQENPTAIISLEEANDSLKRFNSSFEEAYREQSSCIVSNPKLRHEIKTSITRKLMPAYREFYERHRLIARGQRNLALIVRHTPEDIEYYLSDLFYGTNVSVDAPSTSSSSSSKLRRSR
uniref:Exocyst subunit Exo70 family protein n=1 Tax=Rhizophora mucronata TaxID=61149 RepID=A0A2P2J4N5_RHIMU